MDMDIMVLPRLQSHDHGCDLGDIVSNWEADNTAAIFNIEICSPGGAGCTGLQPVVQSRAVSPDRNYILKARGGRVEVVPRDRGW